jgi:DNA (cytosine-5)-methyltransferase 1
MTAPRIGSLFSGAGGLDLAVLDVLGGHVVWHSQYEPPDKNGRPDVHQYAARILAHHWPDVPNLGDITAIDWDQVLADHGPVDVLCGGFPCQDISLAGKRAGMNSGTRSGLWRHMARAIRELQPQLVIIENTRGLLSAPAHSDVEPCPWCLGDPEDEPHLRALGAVLGDLAELGFDAEWIGVPASDVGAPHERWREFILAWPADAPRPGLEDRREGRPGRGAETPADTDNLGGHRPGARDTRRHEPAHDDLAAAHTEGIRYGHTGTPLLGGLPAAAVADSAAAATDADGRGLAGHAELPQGRDTVQRGVRGDADGRGDTAPDALGHALRQQPVAVGRSGSATVAELAGPATPSDTAGIGRREGGAEPARIVGGSDAPFGGVPDWGVYEGAIRHWEAVLGSPVPGPVDDRGRLAPEFPEWMMGYPAGHITAVPPAPGMTPSQLRNARLKAAGNGVVVQQGAAAIRALLARIQPREAEA